MKWKIIDIYRVSSVNDDSNDVLRIKFLVISHMMALKRIPSIFSENSLDIFGKCQKSCFVFIFDLFSNFCEEMISDRFLKIEKFQYNPNTDPRGDVYNLLQKAYTLYQMYYFREKKPLYMTSFLFFEENESYTEPFLLKSVPILRNECLSFRTVIQGSLNAIVKPRKAIPLNSFVLLPPYENPLIVVESSNDILMLMTMNKEFININTRHDPFVLLSNPSIVLKKFFEFKSTDFRKPYPSINTTQNFLLNYEPKEFIKFEPDEIEAFFLEKSTKSKKNECQIEFEPSNPQNIIMELESDSILSEILMESFESRDFYPKHSCHCSLMISSFLSYFRFEFGFSQVTPPLHAQNITDLSDCEYIQLGIPLLAVKKRGEKVLVPANEIIYQWEEEMYTPINGEKCGHFVVFCDSTIGANIPMLKTFINQLSDKYTMYGFGSMTEIPHTEAYHMVHPASLPDYIHSFFQKRALSEFRHIPIISYIVSSPIFHPLFIPHSIAAYISPNSVLSASVSDIKTLAFITYSRIRFFSPSPYGMYHVSERESAALFFGFRYQHPFLLCRDGEAITIHFAYDSESKLLSCVDDIGSVLHVLPMESLDVLPLFLADLKVLLKNIPLRFTVSLFKEFITNKEFNQITSIFEGISEEIGIYTMFPESSIQLYSSPSLIDDAFIIAEPESHFRFESDIHIPIKSGFIVSNNHPPYSVSLLFHKSNNDGDSNLIEFVKHISHLSWLSVKPTSEKRTVSYPPHLAALLRKNNCDSRIVSNFEFLPSVERV